MRRARATAGAFDLYRPEDAGLEPVARLHSAHAPEPPHTTREVFLLQPGLLDPGVLHQAVALTFLSGQLAVALCARCIRRHVRPHVLPAFIESFLRRNPVHLALRAAAG